MTINTTALLNNRYQILESLGRGGFGETFLAIDTYLPSQRKCVIKQLKPVIQDPTIPPWMCDRFEQEARILESLGEKEDQIPQLYAYFQEGQNFFLVQEWIDGITLTEKVEQEGVLPPHEVEIILKKLLPVLTYIHSQNIVHRDLKPDNIIYRHCDRVPVLIDFGAVKEAISDLEKYQGQSAYSIAIGTPGYMPSEQAAGRPLYSSDLYSLGLTTIYLLTGKTPQYLKTNLRTGEIMWRQEIPHLNSTLATVIDRAIRFNPRERFATAEEMLLALKGEPTLASAHHSANYSAYTQMRTKALVGQSPRSSTSASSSSRRFGNQEISDHLVTKIVTREINPVNDNNNQSFRIPLFIPLFLLSLMAIASFLFGYQIWYSQNSQNQPQPEANPENSLDKLANQEIIPQIKDKIKIPKILSENKPDNSPTPVKPEQPAKAIETKPKPSSNNNVNVIPQPQEPISEPDNLLEKAIPHIGLSALNLRRKWGQPSYKGLAYGDRVTVMSYDNPLPKIEKAKYLISNDTQKVVQLELVVSAQSEAAFVTNIMSQSVDNRLGQEVTNAVQEVLTGQTDLRSFYVGDYQGMAQIRNQRVEIRIWDRQFSF